MTLFGNYALFINVIVGLGLIAMLVTGIAMYLKLLRQRKQNGSSGLFWVSTGGKKDWKRAEHRGVGFLEGTAT